MTKKIVLAVSLGVLVAGAGTGAYFYPDLLPFADSAAREGPSRHPSKAGLVKLETFLTHLNDPTRTHHVRLDIRLAVSPAARATQIQEDELLMARIRDHVLTLLSASTLAELSTPEGKEALRSRIHSALTPIVPDAEVEAVLFSDFIVQ